MKTDGCAVEKLTVKRGVRAPNYANETNEAIGDQVEIVYVSDIKIERAEFSGSMFTSLTSTTST